MKTIVALFAGALFGLGLAVSGMTNPQKVIGFLDVAGGADWDPTLAFVMGGALLVAVPAFRLVLGRRRPILANGFVLPTKRALDARLLGGAALFGVGWGLSGFCPGPTLAALSTGLTPVLVFTAATLVGMALHGRIPRRPDAALPPGAGSAERRPEHERRSKLSARKS